jgi:molybdopterin/thiamine biosynthesis adenylyltransferase
MVDARYQRNISALSEEECAKLGRAHVGVAGCGGLGGHVIDQLARIGVRQLSVIDGDVFEDSNLNRQLLCRERDIGAPKAQRAAEYVHEVNSQVKVRACQTLLTDSNAAELLAGCDCVVDALDSCSGKLMVARACSKLGIPLVHGAIAGWYGQVAVVLPGDELMETIYDAPSADSIHKELGNLAPTCACTAAHMAAETVKLLCGRATLPHGVLFTLDLLNEEYETMS